MRCANCGKWIPEGNFSMTPGTYCECCIHDRIPVEEAPSITMTEDTESMEERLWKLPRSAHGAINDRELEDFIRAEISRAKQDFLKEILPEKIREKLMLEDEGWNACIDEILSRSKKILK